MNTGVSESEILRDQQLARLARALGAPARVRILELLAQTPRTVERIASDSGLSIANASQHLRVLREARLVEPSRSGNFITYHLATPNVASLLVCLGKIAEQQLTELRAAREALARRTADVEQINRKTLLRRLHEDRPFSSMCGRPRSTPPDTSPGRCRSRLQVSRNAWASFRRGAMWSPTAAVRTACSPSRQ